MACSPNNAILGVEESSVLRRFWIMVRDGDRVELSVNALLTEERDCDELAQVIQKVAAKGNQTDLGACCTELMTSKTAFVLASFFCTFV